MFLRAAEGPPSRYWGQQCRSLSARGPRSVWQRSDTFLSYPWDRTSPGEPCGRSCFLASGITAARKPFTGGLRIPGLPAARCLSICTAEIAGRLLGFVVCGCFRQAVTGAVRAAASDWRGRRRGGAGRGQVGGAGGRVPSACSAPPRARAGPAPSGPRPGRAGRPFWAELCYGCGAAGAAPGPAR